MSMKVKNRKNIIAAVVGVLLLAMVVAGITYFIHLQNETREKNLKITPTFTGPPTQANQ